jgi:hypothetical protein
MHLTTLYILEAINDTCDCRINKLKVDVKHILIKHDELISLN